MPTYQTPGVYIEEVPGQMKPIEGVATSVAAFIGLATGGPVNTPTKVTSWAEYQRVFGDPAFGAFHKEAFMPQAVHGYFLNGGNNAWIVRVGRDSHGGRPFKELPGAVEHVSPYQVVAHHDALARAAAERNPTRKPGESKADFVKRQEEAMKFRLKLSVTITPSEGEPDADPPVAPSLAVKVVSNLPKLPTKAELKAAEDAASGGESAASGAQPAESKAKAVATTGVQVTEEQFGPLTMTPGVHGFVSTINAGSELIEIVPTGGLFTSEEMQLGSEEFTLELPEEVVPDPDDPDASDEPPEQKVKTSDLEGDDMRQTGLAGLVLADEVTMVCVPDLMSLAGSDDEIRGVQSTLAAFCANSKRMAILDPPAGLSNQEIAAWRGKSTTPATPFATLYWPWLDVLDVNGNRVHVPPCGHVAGVWARTDGTRGVHKAPANEEIRGIVGLGFEVDSVAQGELNSAGINCIRSFKGRGTRIWGARTLGDDPEYRYLNVRRLINYISASLLNGTQWSVFEPNDEILWGQLSVSVSAFLNGVWRSGALFGSSPDEAYFVKCDADTNPPELVAIGQVNVHVGVAPVKPAEFVIFQISQFQPGAA